MRSIESLAAAQRRTVLVLGLAATFGGVGITLGIAAASLLAKEISGSESQAGLAQTFQVLGTAGAAYLMARWMNRRGRRFGLSLAMLIGAAGALLVALAGVVDSMPLLLSGALMLGATTSAGLASRYAATDLATDQTRGRALSGVVWATTVGAVAGPNLAGPAAALAERIGLPELAGPFLLSGLAILIGAAITWIWLRPDPLLTARDLAGDTTASAAGRGLSWRVVGEVIGQRPAIGAAILGVSCAHAVMVAVMVMTPLHMEHGGATLRVIGVVISVHVLGMFGFSPLVGWAVDAWGRWPVLAGGGVVLLVALLIAGGSPEGSSTQIMVGLFLLGLGWSMASIAGATLLTDHTPLAARTDVQGASDLIMNLVAASAGALSGLVTGRQGYPALNAYSAALALAVVGAAMLARRHQNRPHLATTRDAR
ncbi:MAG: MFS transporter [Nocardioides sp.]